MNRWAAPIGLLVILLSVAGPARAGGTPTIPGTPLPAEPGTRALPDGATDAITFDVDGDGDRELVRFAPRTASPGLAAVEVYSFTSEGVPSAVLTKPLLRGTSVDERLDDRATLGIDANGMTPVHLRGDYAAFFVARVAGIPRLLVATYGNNPNQPDPCCLTVWAVELSASFHGLRLVLDSQRSGQQIRVADLDGDGTDELVVVDDVTDDSTPLGRVWQASLYRWDGVRFGRTAIPLEDEGLSEVTLSDSGNSDGLPGDEVLGTAIMGPEQQTWVLFRLGLRAGEPVVEAQPFEASFDPLVVDRNGGEIVLTGTDYVIRLVTWPADGTPEVLAGWPAEGNAVGAIGSGDDSRILVAPISRPVGQALDIINPAGTSFPSVRRPDMAVLTTDIDAALPYFGATPPGLGPVGAWLFAGQIVGAPGTPGIVDVTLGVTLTDVSLMAGLQPIGTVGPGDGWAVVLTRPTGPGTPLPETRVVATSLLLARSEAPLEPTFTGLVGDPADLLVGKEDTRPEASVQAPPGSSLVSVVAGGSQVVATSRISSIPFPAQGLPLTALLTKVGGLTGPYPVRLVTVTSAGAVYQGTWRLAILPGPPSLRVSGPGTVFGSGHLTGRTDQRVTVVVDGQQVEVAPDGSFTADVGAALLPTEVRIVATDVLGQETVRVVSVVAPIDYRQLPWIPIAFAVVVVGGFIWWLRAPRRRPPPAASHGSTGTFEEIEA